MVQLLLHLARRVGVYGDGKGLERRGTDRTAD